MLNNSNTVLLVAIFAIMKQPNNYHFNQYCSILISV